LTYIIGDSQYNNINVNPKTRENVVSKEGNAETTKLNTKKIKYRLLLPRLV
jgi:hypothetical protein